MSNALVTPSTIHDPNWFPDSGVINHMTSDPLNLMDRVDYERSNKVIVGNGSVLHINHVGKSLFTSDLSNRSLLLNRLLHVPAITKNLLSVS